MNGDLGRAPLGAGAWIALLALFIAVSSAIVYPAVTKYPLYDPGLGGRDGDVGQYVRMYRGEPLAEVPRPFRYRVLTPMLARVVPLPPAALLRFFEMNDERWIQLRFGLVNLAGLVTAGLAMVAWARALGIGNGLSLACALLFYTSFPVVNYGGTAMVEAWAWAFLLLAFTAALCDRLVALALVALAGVFAKETVLLAVPAALLMRGPARAKLGRLAALLPAAAAYAVFRFVVLPGGEAFPGDPVTSLAKLTERLRNGPYVLWILWDAGTAFGLLVPLALAGLVAIRGARSSLARLAWLVPAAFVTPFVIGSNIGRIAFSAFPVVIPLAAIGVGRVLGLAAPALDPTHGTAQAARTGSHPGGGR